MKAIAPTEQIGRRIQSVRGHRVMLDSDLAQVYGVSTKRLNEQVKRNRDRFPEDFMFQLTDAEAAAWRSQIATSNPGAKMGLRHRPYAFTEHGALMAANVLKSKRASQVSIFVVRAFVQLRGILAQHSDLAKRLDAVERRLTDHDTALGGHSTEIREVLRAIRQLIRGPRRRQLRIGFKP